MKVILQRDIPKVGKGGDIVTVADGYARNYLFPRGFAVLAAGGALKERNARLAAESAREGKLRGQAAAMGVALDDKTIVILGKVGAGTKLYGSVTAQDVADALRRECNVEVDKRRIGLVDPIKSLGVHTVLVRLHSDMTVRVNVDVTTAEELARRKAEEARRAAEEAAAAAAEQTEAG
ncbi:MAG TPA: 50S ribosomal protein L9 [Chthonomonadales bacterium]|nr:50S ribosomal protein L9 [Chthonomonadales bacterium]